MKKKAFQNNNGIIICDSITMSVKKKRADLRKPEAVLIALLGFVSVIMSFIKMFDFSFDRSKVFTSALVFSVFYISVSLMGKKSPWIVLSTLPAFVFAVYKNFTGISLGFQYVYNVVYKTSYHTEISYYKFLKPSQENECITLLFIFTIWLLALVIYFFTINKPNPFLPLLATFPIIEVGLYNGIEIPVFWGVMTVAYWLSLLSMSAIDTGEVTKGKGGFVRKGNLFFPKRQMKLKVTEKCGMLVIISILIITAVTSAVIKITDYKRSDSINKKRTEIRDAVSSFSMENFAESVSKLTSAFGFTFNYEDHSLGNNDRLKFKNVTDLTVNFDKPVSSAVYIKDYTGSVYGENKWDDLDQSVYSDKLFDDFKKYGIYPQDFSYIFNKFMFPPDYYTQFAETSMKITSKVSARKIFSPYGAENDGSFTYQYDRSYSCKKEGENRFSYSFINPNARLVAISMGEPIRNYYYANNVTDAVGREKLLSYCLENGVFEYDDFFTLDYEIPDLTSEYIYSHGSTLVAELLQKRYRDFVYENYLQLPENSNMDEIREAYADCLNAVYSEKPAVNAVTKLNTIRNRICDTSEYTLSPGKTPSNRDFVNYFLLENHKGYCIHYATAGVVLARMAGIPARYATGYVIVSSDFSDENKNPDGSYTIDVKDNRSHAWAEVYLDGYGWVPFEFTAGYSDDSVAPLTTTATTAPQPVTTASSSQSHATVTSIHTQTSYVRKNTLSESTTTETAVSALMPVSPKGKGGTHKPLPDSVKIIINTFLVLLTLTSIVLLRRHLIIRRRKYLFSNGKAETRAGYMYSYAEKLLSSISLQNTDRKFTDFAEYTEKQCGGEYFNSGEFRKFTDISLKAGFSPEPPDKSDMKFCKEFVDGLSDSIYQKSGFTQKIVMKLITVLN